MSATSFLHPFPSLTYRGKKIPEASQHFCLAKLQHVYYACQSICPLISSDSGMARAVDSCHSLLLKALHGTCRSWNPLVYSRFIEVVTVFNTLRCHYGQKLETSNSQCIFKCSLLTGLIIIWCLFVGWLLNVPATG